MNRSIALRILLVDDDNLVRAGFRSLIEASFPTACISEARNGLEALKVLETEEIDIAISDISMGQMGGIELLRQIRDHYPNVKTMILSMHNAGKYVHQALAASASGYILKSASVTELNLAIQAVVADEIYLSPKIARIVTESIAPQEDHPLDRLTSRQRQVLQLLAEGFTVKQIADLLMIGQKTAETHRSAVMERLGLRSISELVRLAVSEGLISAEHPY